MKKQSKLVLTAALAGMLSFNTSAQVLLNKIGTFDTTLGEGSAEITAFDSLSDRLFVINSDFSSFTIVDLSNPTMPQAVTTSRFKFFWRGSNQYCQQERIGSSGHRSRCYNR